MKHPLDVVRVGAWNSLPRLGPHSLYRKYLHKWETRWDPSFGQAGTQSNPPREMRCWCRNFIGLTSASAQARVASEHLLQARSRWTDDDGKNLRFNTLNRQRKHPTPRWFKFSEHQLGRLLCYEESGARLNRCDTRSFSQANSWYTYQRRQHPGPGFYKRPSDYLMLWDTSTTRAQRSQSCPTTSRTYGTPCHNWSQINLSMLQRQLWGTQQ